MKVLRELWGVVVELMSRPPRPLRTFEVKRANGVVETVEARYYLLGTSGALGFYGTYADPKALVGWFAPHTWQTMVEVAA